MTLTDEEVRHVALLARLGLEDQERAVYREQLASILEHIDHLKELDLSDVPAIAQIIPLEPVLREDVARPSLSPAEALAGAARTERGFFRVQGILD